MKIQEAIANCCQGLKDFTISAVTWLGRTVTALGSAIAGIARKVAEFVKPHFENLKTFVKQNKQPIMIATVACAVGAIAAAIVNRICCKPTVEVVEIATNSTASSVV